MSNTSPITSATDALLLVRDVRQKLSTLRAWPEYRNVGDWETVGRVEVSLALADEALSWTELSIAEVLQEEAQTPPHQG